MYHPRSDLELYPIRSLECSSRFLQDCQEDQTQYLCGAHEDEEKEFLHIRPVRLLHRQLLQIVSLPQPGHKTIAPCQTLPHLHQHPPKITISKRTPQRRLHVLQPNNIILIGLESSRRGLSQYDKFNRFQLLPIPPKFPRPKPKFHRVSALNISTLSWKRNDKIE